MTGSTWVFRGRTWLFGDNINTDYMMPGFTPRGLSPMERTTYCMRANRPGWAEQVQAGDVIVGGRNFGTGSNRPAARILKLLGLSCLVADEINSLMFRNCVNWAFPALACPGVSRLFTEGDVAEVNLKTGTVTNTRTGRTLQGVVAPDMLLDVIAAGGVIPLLEQEGYIRKQG